MNQSDLKKDWLAGNSVVALGGALLLAQSWRLSGGGVELPFGRTIPDVLEVVYVAIVSFLLSANAALPDGQVWAKALSAGGAVMSAFIAFTMVVNPLLRMILGRR